MLVSSDDVEWCIFVFFARKTAYELRIMDWSSDVCSSDFSIRHRPESKHAHPPYRRRAWLSRNLRAKRAGGEAAKTVASVIPPVPMRDVRLAAQGAITHNSQAAKHAVTSVIRRSEERRVGKEGVSTCRSRWSRDH